MGFVDRIQGRLGLLHLFIFHLYFMFSNKRVSKTLVQSILQIHGELVKFLLVSQ